MRSRYFYPLTGENLSNSDIKKATAVLNSKKITMGKVTNKIENFFSKKILNRGNALMVNSGSSANLLIFQALINPKLKKLKYNDEVLIPAICWSTSFWPIVQSGLKPVFVDIELDTFNLSIQDLLNKINKKTKALILVHALGNCTDMEKLVKICKKKKIILIEDTCEALGSKYNNKYLGTYGVYSSFSMYYSHHITSGEGGFVYSKKKIDLIKILRSHGWKKALTKTTTDWKFVNSGFNLRPTDITASIGLNQLKRLDKILKIRDKNFNLIKNLLESDIRLKTKFSILNNLQKRKIAWFGVPITLKNHLIRKKKLIVSFLEKNGIETRPIISGNFANQPAIKLYNIKIDNTKLPNANLIEKNSFLIGLHNFPIRNYTLKRIKKIFLSCFAKI